MNLLRNAEQNVFESKFEPETIVVKTEVSVFRTNGSWPTEQVQDVWNAREVIHHLAMYNLGLREVGTTRGRGDAVAG